MPLGAFRLNLLAKAAAAAGPSRTAKTLTGYGNVEVDTAVKKFGTGSALFSTTAFNDGTTDTIQTNNDSDFIFTGDFTWECWVYMIDNSTSDSMTIMSNRGGFASHNLYFQARHLDMKWQWGNTTMGANVSTATWSYNTWYHVALVRSGSGSNNFTLYVNGTSVGSDTDTNTIGAASSSDYIVLGGIDAGTDWFGLNGHIDDVRVSTTARYTSNFTAPTSAFANDADTVLLVHMDGTDGATTFTDDNA